MKMRRWSTEETRVLQQYINSHLGHCDGLQGDYWSDLCLVLERVRASGDTVLQKHQVTNKIISFRKRQVPCNYILEHGTVRAPTITVENPRRRLHLESHPMTMVDENRNSSALTRDFIEHRGPSRSGEIVDDQEEENLVDGSVFSVSPELAADFGSLPDLRKQLRAYTASSPLVLSETQLTSHENRKRSLKNDSISKISSGKRSNKKSRESRAKRKRVPYEEALQEEVVKKRSAIRLPVHKIKEKADNVPLVHHENESTPSTNAVPASQDLHANDNLILVEASSSPWQELMLHAWHNHLTLQEDLQISQAEPLSHRDVSYMLESISRCVGKASSEMQKIFPRWLDPSSFGSSLEEVLTGSRIHSEAKNILRISQSLPPLSMRTNLLEASLGATIHLWAFKTIQASIPRPIHHDPVRSVVDQFIEKECPKLWISYQNLCRLHFLSSYTPSRITSEAEALTNDVYTLLSTACSSPLCMQSTYTHEVNSSTAFEEQIRHYQAFKANMTKAYQIALDLSISFAKCCDLVYDFEFPRIRDNLDPSCMEVRGAGGIVDRSDGTSVEDRTIAVGLLPSIWSRKRNDHDDEKARTLVTKAVVLL